MDIFYLAKLQLKREGKLNASNYLSLLWDRAIKIRNWLITQERNRKVARNRYKTCSGA